MRINNTQLISVTLLTIIKKVISGLNHQSLYRQRAKKIINLQQVTQVNHNAILLIIFKIGYVFFICLLLISFFKQLRLRPKLQPEQNEARNDGAPDDGAADDGNNNYFRRILRLILKFFKKIIKFIKSPFN